MKSTLGTKINHRINYLGQIDAFVMSVKMGKYISTYFYTQPFHKATYISTTVYNTIKIKSL